MRQGEGPRQIAVVLSALVVIVGVMALSAATVSAAPFHPFLETFGSAAQPSFTDARGIAIYQATGDVYVMDAGSPPSIKRYNADGTPDNFSALGTNVIDGEGGADATPQPGLGFSSPNESQIAIDNSGGATDGNIYVTQSSPNLINVFSSTGTYLGQLTAAGATNFSEACGVAVDPAGAVYVGDYNSGIHKFVPTANPPANADHTATFTTTSQPCTLAAGVGATAGFLFPAQYTGPVSKIDSSTGEVKYSFSDGVTTISVDPATGHVYALKGDAFIEFDASGAGDATSLVAVSLDGDGRGIAVRGSNGNVYVSRQEKSDLAVFGPLTFPPPAAPGITGTAATVGIDEAILRGAIDPGGEPTSYEFEWGVTPAYGNTTTFTNLPADEDPVAVSAVLSGLAPGATYHYRLIAENGLGVAEGSDHTFTTLTSAPSLGPERAYELVSQYPTGDIPVYERNLGIAISEDGNRVHFLAPVPLPGSKIAMPPDHYHASAPRYGSVRGSDGWHVEEYGLGQGYWSSGSAVSADGTTYLFSTKAGSENDARLDPDDANGAEEVYVRRADGSLVWVSRDPRIPVGTPQTADGQAVPTARYPEMSMSVDGSTVVFQSNSPLSDADTTPGASSRLYKWTDGQLSFIGIRPDGSVPVGGSELGGYIEDSLIAVSRDGRRVLFGASRTDGGTFPPTTLYVQTDGEPTVEPVKETGVPSLPADQPFAVAYRGATPDLSRVFFTTNSRLTPDSGGSATPPNFFDPGDADLYLYDIDADAVRDLTPRLDEIEDSTIDPAIQDRGRARGVAAISEDGKRVYFVADAQYDVAPNPEGDLPSSQGRNLYMAELDKIDDPIKLRFIASLDASDAQVWQAGFMHGGTGKTSYASPDGSVLGFGSSMPLTGQALGGTRQLFVYDAEADTLECPSCPSDGSLPAGNVNVQAAEEFFGEGELWQNQSAVKRWVSTDGRVFFHTSSQLLDSDTNDVDDVYEYRAGQLRLVSSGTGTRASRLQAVSRDGGTVIITSSDSLVPFDEEPGIPKLYAARIGGGFPFSPKPASCDLGAGACEGPGTSAPRQPGAGSAAFEGAADPKPKKEGRRCPKGKRKVRRAGKVRCAPSKTRNRHKRNAKGDRRAGR